jgi:hypothetical protein
MEKKKIKPITMKDWKKSLDNLKNAKLNKDHFKNAKLTRIKSSTLTSAITGKKLIYDKNDKKIIKAKKSEKGLK